MPAAILLDVMGTLVYEPFLVEVPAFFGMSLEEILAVKHPTAWVEFEHGRMTEDDFLRNFFADGRPFDFQGLPAAMTEAYAYLDGIEALLKELVDAPPALHLLSNYPVWSERIEAKLKLSQYAPWTFVSWKTGVRKPHPDAYLGPAKTLGVAPDQLLFVDDRGSNCKAARAAGLDAIRFEDAAQLRAELVARGIL